MIESIQALEAKIKEKEEEWRIWNLKELHHRDVMEMCFEKQKDLSEDIHAIHLRINQIKASENPKGWFIRSWGR